ncbi:MAG: hypothetical protein ONB46_08085 [candidate division KSB1 bacterium]|nr:hypothetical protein [candidate division KSB1 bacterium]MDZ7365771.1 hypothetical protein [candidate division KSB1 bacterium]MDZ7403750.1 hypothetical protein [candidate division KSB1 bacterium]
MRYLPAVAMVIALLILPAGVLAQEQVVIIPRPVENSPFVYLDQNNLFAKAYHLFREGLAPAAIDSLKKLIEASGIQLDLRNYYLVVANFADNASPIGLLHEGSDFFNTRLYGLQDAKLYYIFISRQRETSFVSTLLTAKGSPFTEALPQFIGLFIPFLPLSPRVLAQDTTWIDMREFEIPSQFQKFSNISVLVKAELEAERVLGSITLDNTSKERWSFGIATAITSVNDVDFNIGDDGVIRIQPKPRGDLASFAVINYNFQPVDTKARMLATSFHLLGGMRLARVIEPVLGIGFGLPAGIVQVHLFAGYSLEFAQELKSEFAIGDKVGKEDPFKTKLRGKPRFGIELKFP